MLHSSSLLQRMALTLLFSAALYMHGQTITTFDVPNSNYTVARSINDSGQITGYYDGNCFVREPDGTFAIFHLPWPPYDSCYAMDINQKGEIIGYALQPGLSDANGFACHVGDKICQVGTTPFPYFAPLSDSALSPIPALLYSWRGPWEPAPYGECCLGGSVPTAINSFGQTTGNTGYFTMVQRGYVRQPDGKTIYFDIGTGQQFTVPRAINDFGEVVGYYIDTTNTTHGFLRETNGTVITLDPAGTTYTAALAINMPGRIAGFYSTKDGTYGFVRRVNGRYETFRPPDSMDMQVTSMNLQGQITGFYSTADGIYHGFIRWRSGKFQTFDAPGASQGTFPRRINNKGQITGYYLDSNSVIHGFILEEHDADLDSSEN